MQNSSINFLKLKEYGINPQLQTKKSIQQRIIQMYELLEIKTTQNLLMRKQNDDIKLQINTINQLFSKTNLEYKKQLPGQNSEQEVQDSEQENFSQKTDKIIQKPYFIVPKQILQSYDYRQLDQLQNYQKNMTAHNYFIKNRQMNHEQRLVNQNIKKSHLNSRFYGQSKEKQNIIPQVTSRKSYEKIEKTQNNLNQKIQILMKQNQTILKRMNYIQQNLTNRNLQQRNPKNSNYFKFDDRQTNFSSNITSIHKIWSKKDNFSESPYLNHNRKHNSTSNLRQHHPSANK